MKREPPPFKAPLARTEQNLTCQHGRYWKSCERCQLQRDADEGIVQVSGESRHRSLDEATLMKSKGIFPHKAGYKRGNVGGGSAGNSTEPYSAPDNDGYKDGMLGWRSSRKAGGTSGDDMLADRPKASNKSMSGSGGWAWDSSAAPYMGTKGRAQS